MQLDALSSYFFLVRGYTQPTAYLDRTWSFRRFSALLQDACKAVRGGQHLAAREREVMLAEEPAPSGDEDPQQGELPADTNVMLYDTDQNKHRRRYWRTSP